MEKQWDAAFTPRCVIEKNLTGLFGPAGGRRCRLARCLSNSAACGAFVFLNLSPEIRHSRIFDTQVS